MSLTITSWTFDSTSPYVTGTPINLSVRFSSTNLAPAGDITSAITATFTDADGSTAQASDGSADFPNLVTTSPGDAPLTVSGVVVDNRTPAGAWVAGAVTFDPGQTAAPFTGTALFSSVA